MTRLQTVIITQQSTCIWRCLPVSGGVHCAMCIADCSDQCTYKEAQSSGFYILHSTPAIHDNDYYVEHVKYTEL